jgi:hypothetical protein
MLSGGREEAYLDLLAQTDFVSYLVCRIYHAYRVYHDYHDDHDLHWSMSMVMSLPRVDRV